MNPLINLPDVLAEVQAVFAEYERALVDNDVPTLQRLFWTSPYVLRYGAGENLYGTNEIEAFRRARPSRGLARTVTRTSVTTFGRDFAVANLEFRRDGVARIGRQTQTWVRFDDGWKVVAAHVSLMDEPSGT